MIENCNARAKRYAFKRGDDTETIKAKGTKKCVIKYMIKFDDYKDSVLKNKTILQWKLRFKSDHRNIYREEIYTKFQ